MNTDKAGALSGRMIQSKEICRGWKLIDERGGLGYRRYVPRQRARQAKRVGVMLWAMVQAHGGQ
jgi:hypothetical protein